eukprot:gb/GECH01007210.1/.p1 GENE.gb/GECH01007210.1/~~gb/GECH01007210.1/.p1  ORF type:complete len:712 (+),score=240.77 gb/GECH01007210.1/:1-2136(+)
MSGEELELNIQVEKAEPEVRAVPPDTTIEELLRGLEAEVDPKKPQDMGLLLVSENDPIGHWVPIKNEEVRSLNTTLEDTFIYQKKKRPARFFTVDESKKMILIDETQTLDQIRDQAAEKFNLEEEHWKDFGVRKKDDAEHEWLDLNKTLREQNVGPSKVLFFGKRFFDNDNTIKETDKTTIHLTYSEVRIRHCKGDFPVPYDDAITMTALQFQADNGKFVEGKSDIQQVRVLQRTPPMFHSKKNLVKDVMKIWQKMSDMDFTAAKFKFLQKLLKFKLYDTLFFDVKEKKGEEFNVPMILGVNTEGYVRVDPESKEEISRVSFDNVRRWASTPSQVFIYHEKGDGYIVSTSRGSEIESVMKGNFEKWALKYGVDRKPGEGVPSMTGIDYVPLPFTPQAMFQDPEMVRSAYAELKKLERKVLKPYEIPETMAVDIAASSSGDDNQNTDDDDELTGDDDRTEEQADMDDDDDDLDSDDEDSILGGLQTKEHRLLEKIATLEARSHTLQLETDLLDSRLNATSVGAYDPDTMNLQERVNQLKEEHQDAGENMTGMMDELMKYEDGLKNREETLARKELQLKKVEKDVHTRELKVKKLQEALSQAKDKLKDKKANLGKHANSSNNNNTSSSSGGGGELKKKKSLNLFRRGNRDSAGSSTSVGSPSGNSKSFFGRKNAGSNPPSPSPSSNTPRSAPPANEISDELSAIFAKQRKGGE